ncbi:sulfite exporter TauE/SafE family protein [Gordonia tangerina]|uniref:Probable membrane transporter protein n=1 Tax=Gordonia tangerina TaxID=2911060 RepID=A0ABS9DFY5_9ACTN|nr:sulfite exporter TauE/SafE family protein [Gordonia tangerina]MCF3938134.1 sulfite exporter TauE/SafE family protein [Gordonia tangerina]
MDIVMSSIAGLAIGALLGLLGGGGSILAVPALVYGVGEPISHAVPTALLVIAVSSAVAVLPRVRARQVNWRLAGIFAAVGFPATLAGGVLGGRLPESAVMMVFAAVMVVAAVRMLRDVGPTGTACAIDESGIDWRRCASRSIPVAAAVGALTGMLGVGGGFLIIPALVMALGVEMSVAVGTSLLIIAANSVSGILAHVGDLDIDWAITATFAGAAIVASLIAAIVGARLRTQRLQRCFAYLVLVVAAFVVTETIVVR